MLLLVHALSMAYGRQGETDYICDVSIFHIVLSKLLAIVGDQSVGYAKLGDNVVPYEIPFRVI